MRQRISRQALVALVLLMVALPPVQASPRSSGSTLHSPAVGWTERPTPVEREGAAWRDLPPEVRAKIDPRIWAELNGQVRPAHLGGDAEGATAVPESEVRPRDKTRFLVYLEAQADLGTIRRQHFATQVARRVAVFDALVGTARATQGPVKSRLDARRSGGDVTTYQSFYIFNGFAVEGDRETVIELAQRHDVERLVANYPLEPLWKPGEAAASPPAGLGGLSADNWNIDLVDAERVWDELGITGVGAVVGGIDTGVDWTHPALQSRYRGYDVAGTDHNYHWFDPDGALYPGGDLGPSVTTAPYDTGSHGTHTMGTMVGDGGKPGTQVGMAPGARWIAISLNDLILEGSIADDIRGHKAFQWMLCPTDLSGALSTADCSRAPDVVNNSWGSSNPADDTFRPAIQALRAAGIAPVFAAGNPGAGAGSIGSPGSAPEAITVGATDINDQVASFSGRGPSLYEGEQKPELSAPGVGINSTTPGGGYSGAIWSGTSMAAPHVAGLVALMSQADRQDGIRDFDVDELERFMAHTALDLGPAGPDDDYGHGRIDAYDAVRWALSAGDLRGTVTDQSSGLPIAGARITGTRTATGDAFTAASGANGAYSTTVPAGLYNVTVGAWGYQGDTFAGQAVFTDALSIKNFALTPLPTGPLTGTVLSGTTPISGAVVSVAAHPATRYTTGADGAYTLTLPLTTHALSVEATGYRILSADVPVPAGGASHDFGLTPAPTILLVEADASYGWFVNRPVHRFFTWALDGTDYLYEVWKIEDTSFHDTQTLADGSLGHGVPSVTTLQSYDLVIWAHTADSPDGMGFDDELMSYLDGGGRLILSGQDIGLYDDGTTFYDDYLHADFVADDAAGEGETISGVSFLEGLHLEVTNAALHSYANSALDLWPDAVTMENGAAYPVLTYDNGSGAAALAVDPCGAPYRAVYLAVGYENVAPRAYQRDLAIAQVIDESIQWAWAGSKPAHDVQVAALPARRMEEPGGTVTYTVQMINTGTAMDVFTLTTEGHLWPTRILSGGIELSAPVEIPACGLEALTAEVNVPLTARPNETDVVTFTVSSGDADADASATTVAFPHWQVEAAMPTPRYRLAGVALPGDVNYYAMGGLADGAFISLNTNERYNACTGQWDTLAPLPTAVGNIQGAAIGDEIYVPGGYDGVTGTTYDILQIYDITANTWRTGASLPETLWGAGVAAHDGLLYTFGGGLSLGATDRVFAYDPASDTWTEKSPMPGGARSALAAAALDGKIYVAGGWDSLRTVEVYDPATDSWSTAAPMNVGRQSPGLVAGPDGYLYVAGGGNGWNGLSSAERYDPATDTWEFLPTLNDGARAGVGAVFAAGRIFAAGGGGATLHESLHVTDSFCLSGKAAQQSAVQPGDRLSYTVEIHADATALASVHVADAIPDGTTFAGFGANGPGATYNATEDRVEWSGAVPAGGDPLTFTFGVDVDATGWVNGETVVNEVTFDGGPGLVFTRTATTPVLFPDPSSSVKTVHASDALAGDVLTYTVRVRNASSLSDTFALLDPIPADAIYVPGSLSYTHGSAGYDAGRDVITWTGELPYYAMPPYTNTGGDYAWGDSNGNGDVPDVTFDWIDIRTTGIPLDLGDDTGAVIPLGFDFTFYGNTYPDPAPRAGELGVSSNGYLTLEPNYDDGPDLIDKGEDCPITNSFDPNDTIAPFWDDLDAGTGNVYYQLLGTAPVRSLVIQWQDVEIVSTGATATFQAILYEGANAIKFQYQTLTTSTSYAVGIENRDATAGITYNACGASDVSYDGRALLFLPGGATWPPLTSEAGVTFAVRTDDPLPTNTRITNTAIITGPLNAVERHATTLLNPVDLSASTKRADVTWAQPGERITYHLLLTNTGRLTATAALTDPIPTHTTYVSQSVSCGGTCAYDLGLDAVTWHGDVIPGAPVTLTFAVTLTEVLADRTPVTNTATLEDGAGTVYDLQDTFLARSPNLAASFKRAQPERVAPGGAVTYTVYVHNTGVVAGEARVRDGLPPELAYVAGSLVCGSGVCGEASGVITWTGTVPGRSVVPVQFQATLSDSIPHGDVITNTAVVTDVAPGTGHWTWATVEVVNPTGNPEVYLPLVLCPAPE